MKNIANAVGSYHFFVCVKEHIFNQSLSGSGTDTLLEYLPILALVSGVVAPIFRRALLDLFVKIKKLPVWISIVSTSVLFAGWHLTWEGFPNLFWLGIIFSVSYVLTNRLWVPILIHVLMNSFVAVVFLLIM